MNKLAKSICAILIILLLAILMISCAKPLTLTITAPTHGGTVTASPIEVRGYVSDAKATVWVNDTIVTLTKGRTTASFSTNLELAEGENTIKVTAARGKPDKWKDAVARTVTVTYSPK
ncbi:MAG: hypothetical protein KKD83_10670 [Chloroflexi bacterium]|nr:hypothetical protein [Chloroflexota bacterium]